VYLNVATLNIIYKFSKPSAHILYCTMVSFKNLPNTIQFFLNCWNVHWELETQCYPIYCSYVLLYLAMVWYSCYVECAVEDSEDNEAALGQVLLALHKVFYKRIWNSGGGNICHILHGITFIWAYRGIKCVVQPPAKRFYEELVAAIHVEVTNRYWDKT
jgi:hypothetical protein